MNRLESLDWLRGLLAVSIMVYHLTGWKLYQPDASELLGRLGIYGVSMFFVLSGLSMAAGYNGFMRDGRSAIRFFVRRIFRIWPLLWVAVAAVTLGGLMLKGKPVDWPLVMLNITTLFGFVRPGAYINTGAWSIGNEMVYYALTPALLAAYDRKLAYGNALVAASVAVGLYFAFQAIGTHATLASQWQTYINPMNNLYLYATGVALYYNTNRRALGAAAACTMLVAAMAAFLWYPVAGDLVHIVTGVERVVFSMASILLVLSFYGITSSPTAWISRPLVTLGLATYGVYLLHPIVYQAVELSIRGLGWSKAPLVTIALTVVLTIAIAIALYACLEAPFIRLGKRLTSGSKGLTLQVRA